MELNSELTLTSQLSRSTLIKIDISQKHQSYWRYAWLCGYSIQLELF